MNARKLDIFGKHIGFNFRGEQSYMTCHGACLSFIVLILVMGYSVTKFVALYNHDDSSYQTRMRTNLDIG